MRKVRITALPKAQSGLEVKMKSGLGFNSNVMPWPIMAGEFSEPEIEVNKTLLPVAREGANLEAELGEYAFTDKTGDGIPQLYRIGGKRHYDGGTPLNLPDDSFIYSRDNSMKIGGDILNSFGKNKGNKKKFTPAELASQYQINDFRKVLADKDTDKTQRETAELMIANYNLKLAKLGLVQESTKGFPDGIPRVSMPYMEMMGIDPSQFFGQQGQEEQGEPRGQQEYQDEYQEGQEEQPLGDNTAKYGGTNYLPKAQNGTGVMNSILNVLEAPQRAMMWAGTGAYNTAAGKGWQGKYEMPGTVLKENYPDTPGWLTTVTDIVADPLLISGVGKSIARTAIKEIGHVGAEVASKKVAKAFVKKGAVDASHLAVTDDILRAVLKRAGKPATEINMNLARKAVETGINQGVQTAAKTTGRVTAKVIQKEIYNNVIRSTGRTAQAEVIKAGAKGVGTGIVYAGELAGKAASKVGQAGEYVVKKAAEVAPKVVEAVEKGVKVLDNPFITPVALPIVANTRSAIARNYTQEELEKQQKENEELKKQLKIQSDKNFKTDKLGNKYYEDSAGKKVFITQSEFEQKRIPLNTKPVTLPVNSGPASAGGYTTPVATPVATSAAAPTSASTPATTTTKRKALPDSEYEWDTQ
jgi:hypothetical protein